MSDDKIVKYCGTWGGANCCHFCGRDLSVEGFCADGKGSGNLRSDLPPKIKASAACPICGKDTPHSHPQEELIANFTAAREQIATLQARAEKAEQNLVDYKASRVMCGERAMRLEQELIALKAGIPVVVGYVDSKAAGSIRKTPFYGIQVLVMPISDSKYQHPIYLDPQPPSKGG